MATKTSTRSETKAAKTSDPTAERLAKLRERAAGDPTAARDEAWSWFREAGARLGHDRAGATEELGQLFRSGAPSAGIDGPVEGTLVGLTITPILDRAFTALAGVYLPWTGKRFDAAQQRGDNMLLKSARIPAKVFWPRYSLRPEGEQLAGFDFETRVEPGVLDPDVKVLVIDYAPVRENPWLIIKQIRDEVVEVVPGAHLGKMIFFWGQGDRAKYRLGAYFALKS